MSLSRYLIVGKFREVKILIQEYLAEYGWLYILQGNREQTGDPAGIRPDIKFAVFIRKHEIKVLCKSCPGQHQMKGDENTEHLHRRSAHFAPDSEC